MNATFQIADSDQRAFDEAMRQYLKLTSRTVEEAINTKMLFIANAALKSTPQVERSVIESSLNVIGHELRRTSKGKVRKGKAARGAALFGGKLIYRIVNARNRNAGRKGMTGEAMKEAAQALLRSRIKGIGTLKAGFAQIVRVFAKKLKQGSGLAGLPRVKMRGQAYPAEVSEKDIRLDATAIYQLGAKTGHGKGHDIHPHVQRAVEQAFNAETASMVAYIEDKLRSNQAQANL